MSLVRLLWHVLLDNGSNGESLSLLAARVVATSVAFGCLSTSRLVTHQVDMRVPPLVDMRVPLLQFASVWTAHVWNFLAPYFLVSVIKRNIGMFPPGSLYWTLFATGLMSVGVCAEVCAHFQDRWVYGKMSLRSCSNFFFQLGLISSLTGYARAMYQCFLTDFSGIAIPIMVSMVYFTVPSKYYVATKTTLQMLATGVFCFSHGMWSGDWWSLFFLVQGAGIVYNTVVLESDGNQWLHIPQSFQSSFGLLVVIMLKTGKVEWVRNMGLGAVLTASWLSFVVGALLPVQRARSSLVWNLYKGQSPKCEGVWVHSGGVPERAIKVVGTVSLLAAHTFEMIALGAD